MIEQIQRSRETADAAPGALGDRGQAAGDGFVLRFYHAAKSSTALRKVFGHEATQLLRGLAGQSVGEFITGNQLWCRINQHISIKRRVWSCAHPLSSSNSASVSAS